MKIKINKSEKRVKIFSCDDDIPNYVDFVFTALEDNGFGVSHTGAITMNTSGADDDSIKFVNPYNAIDTIRDCGRHDILSEFNDLLNQIMENCSNIQSYLFACSIRDNSDEDEEKE